MSHQKISPNELYEKLKNNRMVKIIDVRAEEKYKDFHIDHPQVESFNIPKTDIFGINEGGKPLFLPKIDEWVITCTTGNSAAKCANILSEHGYKATVLEGGLTAWKEYLKELEANE